MLIVCFVLFFVVCFSSTLSPRPDRSMRSGNNLMRLEIILQHAIMAYHVQIAHELHVISRLHSCRARNSCYRPILRLRHLSLIVHSRSKLVHSLLYHDMTGYEYGDLVFGECGRVTNRTRTEYRCVSGVKHHRQARYVFNLTLSCPPILLLQSTLIYLQ